MDNLVGILEPNSNTTASHYILLSAHYDTGQLYSACVALTLLVALSRGAFDDTSGVGTLLEVLSVLTKTTWESDLVCFYFSYPLF